MPLSPGDKLGPYEILAQIGAGGMGEVYRARDSRLNRDVALKVLPGDLARDPGRRKRFEQEARSVAALNHPNIVAVYDVGTNYFVSELVDGNRCALWARCRRAARLSCLRRSPMDSPPRTHTG
jgi:eukaryotic-like serine/threonine-protein kinase